MHPDLYNFHTRSPATTSVASGSSTSSALSLTESPASSGNCQSSQYWAGLLLYLLRSRVCQVLVIWLFSRLPPASSPSSEADLGEGLRGVATTLWVVLKLVWLPMSIPFHTKNNIMSYNISSSPIDHYKKTVAIPPLDSLIIQMQDRFLTKIATPTICFF